MPPTADRETTEQPASAGGSRIALLAIVIMLGNVLSRVLGLIREQFAASLFGTGNEIAAFTVADNLQTLLFDLMVSGALQAALIPVLAQRLAPDSASRAEFRRVGGTLIVLATIFLGLLAILGMVFAPALVDGLVWVSGDADARGEGTIELTVRLVRIALPAAIFLGIGTLLQAMLYALGRVGAPAFSTALRNLAIIVAALVLSDALGVESMAWGTLGGAIAIVLLQIGPLRRAGMLPTWSLDLRSPALRQIVGLYFPVFLGLIVSSVAVIVDRGLAWGAGTNALGAMRYATTLVQLVLGIVAAAIGLAALPTLSRHFAAGDERAFRTTLGQALILVTVLIFPATLGLAALSSPISSLLFGYGATSSDGLHQIIIALLGYLPGAVAAAFDQVLIFAFYARHNTKLPVLVGVVSVGVYFVVALSLVHVWGMMGLVIANSAQFIAHATIMWWIARSRFGWIAEPRLNRLIPRCAGSAIAMAALVWVMWWGLDRVLPEFDGKVGDVARQLGVVALPAAFGAVVYTAGIWSICRDDLLRIRNMVTNRFP